MSAAKLKWWSDTLRVTTYAKKMFSIHTLKFNPWINHPAESIINQDFHGVSSFLSNLNTFNRNSLLMQKYAIGLPIWLTKKKYDVQKVETRACTSIIGTKDTKKRAKIQICNLMVFICKAVLDTLELLSFWTCVTLDACVSCRVLFATLK